jgi:hypothetical protein
MSSPCSDDDHTVDFREFSQAMAVFLKGSFDEKLRCT